MCARNCAADWILLSQGDMFVSRERGRAQSLYGLGPLLGPVCGTIAGGWIAQALHSWRWLLGTLTIVSIN